jgi:uncharacterized membrane protein (DUF2068 family)
VADAPTGAQEPEGAGGAPPSLPGVLGHDDRDGVRRYLPRFHYELLVCGLRGHAIVGAGCARIEPADEDIVRQIDGIRWHRCLRCDSWLPLAAPPPAAVTRRGLPPRGEIDLPLRGKPLRDKIVLRLIAIDRVFHFLVLALASVAVFFVASDRTALRDQFYDILDGLHAAFGGFTTGGQGGFIERIDDLLSFSPGKLHLIGAVLAFYAILEGVEAVGLWLQKRWAEYLTFIATTLLLPLEIYELTEGVKPLKVSALIVNLAVVAYLIYAKRLFGVRGGLAAEEELAARDYGWPAIERSSPEAFR